MASTFSNLGFELQTTGENANTWGDKTNVNLELIDERLSAIGTITNTSSFSLPAPSNATKSVNNGAATLKFTGSASSTVVVTMPAKTLLYNVINSTGQDLTFQCSTTTTTATIKNGQNGVIHSDGSANVYLISTVANDFEDDVTITTGDGALLTLRTSEATVVDGDVLGALQFRASAETGADALAVAASIVAEADDEFDADSAATDFVFKLGTTVASDDTAIEKMRLTHEGDLNLVTDDKKINFGADSDINITHVADTGLTTNGDFSVGDDLKLTSDGAVLGFGADNEVTITHVHDTGLRFEDSDKLLFGAGSDLQIFHDGTDSKITNSTGHFKLLGDSIALNNAAEGANLALFTAGGAAKLYFNGSEKLATSSAGVSVTGTLTASEVTATSDERLKSDIQTIDNALDKVMNMRGVSFTKQAEKGVGVIAQEIEKVLPEVVTDGEYKSVAYGNIVGVLIEAIKELKTELNNHKQGCKCHGSSD